MMQNSALLLLFIELGLGLRNIIIKEGMLASNHQPSLPDVENAWASQAPGRRPIAIRTTVGHYAPLAETQRVKSQDLGCGRGFWGDAGNGKVMVAAATQRLVKRTHCTLVAWFISNVSAKRISCQ